MADTTSNEIDRVAAALHDIPIHFTDKDEDSDERNRRIRGVALAIVKASTSKDGSIDYNRRAALITLARFESHLARYVQENRCKDGPGGRKECDYGRAKGLWQLHASRRDGPVPDDLFEQADRAGRRWAGAYAVCKGIAEAFTAYGTGGKCYAAPWSIERAKYFQHVRSRL